MIFLPGIRRKYTIAANHGELSGKPIRKERIIISKEERTGRVYEDLNWLIFMSTVA